jgi:isochorismate hydrolase
MYSEREVLELARQAYKVGEATFEVVAEACALLVIDMQDEFVKPDWTPYWVPEATRRIPTIQHLVKTCRTLRIPVILSV